MTSKTFKPGTVIDSDWLNDVNSITYNKAYTTTARNALTNVTVGTMVYDTSLGRPIWLHSTTGPVWHDATGTPV